MPIIKDPKMNDTEKQFGIIEYDGAYAYYDKENSDNNKRYLPSGFFVPMSAIELKQKNPPYVIIHDGQVINLKAKFSIDPDYDPSKDPNQGPVISAIFLYLKNEYQWPTSEEESELVNPQTDSP